MENIVMSAEKSRWIASTKSTLYKIQVKIAVNELTAIQRWRSLSFTTVKEQRISFSCELSLCH